MNVHVQGRARVLVDRQAFRRFQPLNDIRTAVRVERLTRRQTPNEARDRGNELLAEANRTKDPVERKRLWGEAQTHFAKVGGSAAQ